MAGRLREHDWASTPLGPIEGWPQCLKTVVDMLLSNGFAMTALWGRDLIQIYNDAHRDLIADRHPGALGRPTRDVWAERWTQTAPIIDRVWAGETLTFFDVPQTVTRRGRTESGWFTNSYSPLGDETGAVAGVLVTSLETTERMRAQTALRDSEAVEREVELRLRASEQRFRALVQSIRDYAIVGLDADGRITEWTDGAAKVIGYSGKSALGSPVSMLYPPDDVRRGAPEQVLAQAREQGRVEVDGWRVRKDGTRFWANAIVIAIGDESGAIVGYTKVIRDLSEQKEMLEQREQLLAEATAARAEAERANQTKDEFLITLSHELRTPLAPILLWARALLEGSVPAHEVDHAVEAIVLSAESQLQLIEDLRDLSRLKSGRVQLDRHSNSVEEVARAAVEVIMPSAQAKGVRVELDVMPDLGNAVLDGGRFQQVLWNLLSNAVKFTPDGGRVSLHVRRQDDQLEVVVADTGVGIEASFLPHLFQRFRQAQPDTPERHRYGGLGVGLALCRYLVELHGGTVEGTSEGPGRGAVFKVQVPWVTPDVASATDTQDVLIGGPTPSALLGLKVLLVEDDANMRDIMRWTLEGAGASVVPVSTGSEAIEVIEAGEQAAAPDVMVCDLGLPGMNGFDLIERICEQRRSRGQRAIPACAVSAFAREVDRERAIDAGFDSYLAKPMTAQRLIDAVEELAAVAADDRV